MALFYNNTPINKHTPKNEYDCQRDVERVFYLLTSSKIFLKLFKKISAYFFNTEKQPLLFFQFYEDKSWPFIPEWGNSVATILNGMRGSESPKLSSTLPRSKTFEGFQPEAKDATGKTVRLFGSRTLHLLVRGPGFITLGFPYPKTIRVDYLTYAYK
ncbi:hypothetical protein ES703_100692 [subsurface metagenome]